MKSSSRMSPARQSCVSSEKKGRSRTSPQMKLNTSDIDYNTWESRYSSLKMRGTGTVRWCMQSQRKWDCFTTAMDTAQVVASLSADETLELRLNRSASIVQ
mmetsp:Transcript_8345/g.25082  ORF Transcript_8345/g.25082 Transcript_8345/m.25082 type:complete len:101 (-) Transcript_8345:157-459(-)